MTKIIQGNFGPKPKPEPGPYAKKAEPLPRPPGVITGVDMAKPGVPDEGRAALMGPDGKIINLTADQHKALGLIISGMPFVLVAIKPTNDGADFFTALHGDPGDLRNAQDELPAVIARLYSKKGITQ